MQRMSEGGDCPRERMQGACMRPCSPALGGMRQYMWKPLRLDNSHGCLIKNDCCHMVYEPVDDRLVDVRLDVTPPKCVVRQMSEIWNNAWDRLKGGTARSRYLVNKVSAPAISQATGFCWVEGTRDVSVAGHIKSHYNRAKHAVIGSPARWRPWKLVRVAETENHGSGWKGAGSCLVAGSRDSKESGGRGRQGS